MNSTSNFISPMGQRVRIAASGETGEVRGRAEYLNANNSYLIRHQAADGRAVEAWWPEDALVTA